jgi:hypothetical protein
MSSKHRNKNAIPQHICDTIYLLDGDQWSHTRIANFFKINPGTVSAIIQRYKVLNILDFRAEWEKRFWSKVDKNTQSGCWEWTAAKHTDGYGQFNIKGKLYRANRIAWQLHFGNIPEEFCVCHKCDNPACCNPKHLFLGTHNDNNKDMKKKNRNARGSKNGHAKVTEEDITQIKRMKNIGIHVDDIAVQYGISKWTIYDICRGRIWKHVD